MLIKRRKYVFPFQQSTDLGVIEITVKYLLLSTYPVQVDGLSGHARTCRPGSGHFYGQHLYKNRIFWFPFSHFFPCLRTWFVKALKSDLNSIIDNSLHEHRVFYHVVLYIILWYLEPITDGATKPSQKWPYLYVCISVCPLDLPQCWHMYMSLIVIKLFMSQALC